LDVLDKIKNQLLVPGQDLAFVQAPDALPNLLFLIINVYF
jgi:hypothetical protein